MLQFQKFILDVMQSCCGICCSVISRESMLVKILTSFLVTLVVIQLLLPVARKVGLLDKPDERKQHQGVVPLIGGVALYFSFIIISYFFLSPTIVSYSWLIGSGILVFIGALDDKHNLSIRIRILAAIIAALFMIIGADTAIYSLGNLFSFGELTMPVWVAIPFTAIMVFAVINALNMCDGIDGLAACLIIVSLVSLGIMKEVGTTSIISLFSLVAALCAFLAYNLQFSKKLTKVFLGDAGSMMLGYSVVWLLITYSQNSDIGPRRFAPVTALYIVGLPLLDMACTVIRRVNHGFNPFQADRTHIHHILLNAGFSSKQTLGIIVILGSMISGTGIILHKLAISEFIQLLIYLAIFCVYYLSLRNGLKDREYPLHIHG